MGDELGTCKTFCSLFGLWSMFAMIDYYAMERVEVLVGEKTLGRSIMFFSHRVVVVISWTG